MKITRQLISGVFLSGILLVCCVPSSTTQKGSSDTQKEIVLSEKIGSVVDQDIRARYNLFPDLIFYIKDKRNDTADVRFIDARFYRLGKGGYIVRIRLDGGVYDAQNTGARAIAILQDYLASYDSMVQYGSRKKFEEKWEVIDYDVLGQPITLDEVEKYTRVNRRMVYTGLGVMAGGMAVGGITGCAIGTWTSMLSGCLGGVGGSPDPEDKTILITTLTCAGLGAVPGAATMVTAQVMRKKYSDAVNHIKHQRLPYVSLRL